MKIILVGGGKVGFALCRSLVAEKHDVLLIEQDEAVQSSRLTIPGRCSMTFMPYTPVI